jgi:hypothetical protein
MKKGKRLNLEIKTKAFCQYQELELLRKQYDVDDKHWSQFGQNDEAFIELEITIKSN